MDYKPSCRKCGSQTIYFTKHLHSGMVQGTSFHYKLWCRTCNSSYYTKRTKYIFEAIKDKQWKRKKKPTPSEFVTIKQV